ncbi:GM22177 [Drosophila sechellia]|uniref:GM22177 n=1 Tax=Drosophila sechellia TaxID=7238 RepID=B4IAH7_DROSE|nr:GM22177 [Drosophila sechellia]
MEYDKLVRSRMGFGLGWDGIELNGLRAAGGAVEREDTGWCPACKALSSGEQAKCYTKTERQRNVAERCRRT